MCPPSSNAPTTTTTASKPPSLSKQLNNNSNKPLLSWPEIALHDGTHAERDSKSWICIEGTVYDITAYMERHPGGPIITTFAGRDATDVFRAWHGHGGSADPQLHKRVRMILKSLPVVGYTTTTHTLSQYEQDKRALYDLAESRYYSQEWTNGQYLVTLTVPWLLAITAIYYATQVASTYVELTLAGLVLGLAWQQAAFCGHDIGHGSVWKLHESNTLGLLWGNFLFGISASWWKLSHNLHHAVTNEYDRDPDISLFPLVALDEKSFWAQRFRNWSPRKQQFVKRCITFQNYTFVPILMFIARFYMSYQSYYLCIVGKHAKVDMQAKFLYLLRIGEFASLCGYWMWFGGTLRMLAASNLGVWGAVAFGAAAHIYVGILHVQIASSHWDRPKVHVDPQLDHVENDTNVVVVGTDTDTDTDDDSAATPAASSPTDSSASQEDVSATSPPPPPPLYEWCRVQCETTRNIAGGSLVGWYFGGLHLQIEHHLFPRMPRHQLRNVQPHVQAFCAKHNLAYTNTSWYEAFSDVLSAVDHVAHHVHESLQDEQKQQQSKKVN